MARPRRRSRAARPVPVSEWTALLGSANNVWSAWQVHRETGGSPEPGRQREPMGSIAVARRKECRRASRVFLKTLRAYPPSLPGLGALLASITEHVSLDIPALTAVLTHPQAPPCSSGDIVRLLTMGHQHWYAPSGLGPLLTAMLARGARADHGSGHAQPLLQAVEIASPEAVSVLTAAGANVEGLPQASTDPFAHPLTLAFILAHADCVEALLNAGADPKRLHPQAHTIVNREMQDHPGPYRAARERCAGLVRANAMEQRLQGAWSPPAVPRRRL